MKRIILVTLCLTLAACRWESPGLVETPPETEPNQTLSKEVHWARNSAEHRAAMLQTFRLVTERVEELARDREPGTWAVAVDADETAIDNSLFEVEIGQQGYFGEETWHDWVIRQEATAQPGAVAFLERVHELGGKIAVVTNRQQKHCADTEAVFGRQSIPYDVMLCREGEERDKSPRWEKIERGTAAADLPPLEILVWVGDNIIDFPGGTQALRHEPESAFQGFGDRFFILPNPMYGSWEDNPQE